MGWLDHDRLGFNYRLSDVASAIGVAQVEKLPSILERRGAVAAAYAERLAEVPGVTVPMAARGRELRSWFVYVVRLDDAIDRDAVMNALREVGIDSKVYLPSVHLYPHLRELGYREGQFPVAEAASAHSLALPFFTSMSEAQIERVCTELARAVDGSRG
jgi:perosamine synthetase